MLFRRAVLDAIATGDVHLAFRRWDRPRVAVGTRLRTQVGVLEVIAVDEVDPAVVRDADARAAGLADAAAVIGDPEDTRALYRVGLRHVGEDPRLALREAVPDAEEVAAVRARLDAFDARSRRGPWTRVTLDLIAEHPATVARDLAARIDREVLAFKRDVRVLKELGLTESLGTGYRLSPRGEAVLGH